MRTSGSSKSRSALCNHSAHSRPCSAPWTYECVPLLTTSSRGVATHAKEVARNMRMQQTHVMRVRIPLEELSVCLPRSEGHSSGLLVPPVGAANAMTPKTTTGVRVVDSCASGVSASYQREQLLSPRIRSDRECAERKHGGCFIALTHGDASNANFQFGGVLHSWSLTRCDVGLLNVCLCPARREAGLIFGVAIRPVRVHPRRQTCIRALPLATSR